MALYDDIKKQIAKCARDHQEAFLKETEPLRKVMFDISERSPPHHVFITSEGFVLETIRDDDVEEPPVKVGTKLLSLTCTQAALLYGCLAWSRDCKHKVGSDIPGIEYFNQELSDALLAFIESFPIEERAPSK